MLSRITQPTTNSASTYRFSTTEPADYHCPDCHKVLPFALVKENTWQRGQCDCDRERESFRTAQIVAACDRKVSSLIHDGIEAAGIPAKFRAATFENTTYTPDNTAALNRLKEWSESVLEQPKGIYLYGKVGRGKTRAVCCALKNAYLSGALIIHYRDLDISAIKRKPAYFVSMAHWFKLKGKEMNRTISIEESDVLSAVDSAGLLVCDDILPEDMKWTPKPKEWIYELVNSRYNRNLPTIYTANARCSMVTEVIGEPVGSRIAETTEKIELCGVNWRTV